MLRQFINKVFCYTFHVSSIESQIDSLACGDDKSKARHAFDIKSLYGFVSQK